MIDQKSDLKNQNQDKRPKPELGIRLFKLSLGVIHLVDSLPMRVSTRIIASQLIRAVTSIGANIVEAKASSSKREFMNYFQISLKSANESKYWLALLGEITPEKRDDITKFVDEVNEISKIIGSSILTMKGKRAL